MPYIAREGVNLYYEEAGFGPALVFVHGWCCDHTHFQFQFEHFARTHRVVSVDLRGHGLSDKPGEDYSMPVFADDVAYVCRELGIEHIVAIGHSMGGSVITAMADRHPDLVQGCVAVDSGLISNDGSRERLTPRIEAMAGPDYLSAATAMVDSMFQPFDDPARRANILTSMTSAPQHTMVSAMRANLAQTAESLGTIAQPFLLISAGWLPTDLPRLRENIPGLSFCQTYGSGHFSMLEVPGQVNAILERFLVVGMAETAS